MLNFGAQNLGSGGAQAPRAPPGSAPGHRIKCSKKFKPNPRQKV